MKNQNRFKLICLLAEKITGKAVRWGGSEEGLASSEDCVDISADLRDVAVAHGETGGLVAASGSWSDGTKFYVCARGPNHPKEMQGIARSSTMRRKAPGTGLVPSVSLPVPCVAGCIALPVEHSSNPSGPC